MKNILKISLVSVATLTLLTGCMSSKENVKPAEEVKPKPLTIEDIENKINMEVNALALKANVKDICSVENNGINKVLDMAKLFNNTAIEKGLEFRRLGVNNSGLIASVESAIKTGAKEVNPKDFKGKKSKTKLETNYAAWRACTFSIRALQQAEEAKSSWRKAVPGDGYKYK